MSSSFLKAISLFFVLGLVFWLSRSITAEKISTAMLAVGAPIDETINICRSRIARIEFEDGLVVEERHDGQNGRNRWVALIGSEIRDLDYVQVEKWLAINCRAKFKHQSYNSGAYSEAKIFFVDGSNEFLWQSSSTPSGRQCMWKPLATPA